MSYPRFGLDAATVRQAFDWHVTGHYGAHGTHDATPLTSEESWLIGTLPIGRQNDAAILSGYGPVRSDYGDTKVISILTPHGARTLIYTPSLLDTVMAP